jgi:hypothetical protein
MSVGGLSPYDDDEIPEPVRASIERLAEFDSLVGLAYIDFNKAMEKFFGANSSD